MLKKIAIILMSLGALTLIGMVVFQTFGDTVISEVRKSESKEITPPSVSDSSNLGKKNSTQDNDATVRQYTIKVSNKGGAREMNYCAGGFTEMIHYEGLNDKRLLSSHNNCGGDIVLPMAQGDHVVIEGDQEYVITELRDTGKRINTGAINDMNGTVLLQSCYYRDNRMKFAALTPIAEYYK